MKQQMPPEIPLAAVTAVAGGGAVTSVEQMQHVFHELHADGRHTLCAVCGSQ